MNKYRLEWNGITQAKKFTTKSEAKKQMSKILLDELDVLKIIKVEK